MMASAAIQIEPMTPQDFLQSWDHLIDANPEKPKLYKGAQNKLLSEVLGVEEATVRNWGKDYTRMPDQYLRTLDLADQLRQVIEGVYQGDLVPVILKRLQISSQNSD